MADIYDTASKVEELNREQALQAHRNAPRLQPTGRCHNCGEPVPAGGLFCDADCSADHELRTRRQ